jgi:hypothetical protein
METVTHRPDVAVVGGGMAGTAAALSAARHGAETALIQNRPVLGGNASSEVRVWVNGATGGAHNKYAREGGIMEELLCANRGHNPNGDADLWDAVLVDAVRAQDRLNLHLNTHVDDVETGEGGEESRVTAVAGTQQTSEVRHRFEAGTFVDATGDGLLAAAAGAEWIQGREAADEYGERAAPEAADDRTLGSSIMFYTKDAGDPVDYEPPDFARDFKSDPPAILAQRADPQQERCCYWWIEYGGADDVDPVCDAEAVRDELWAIVYGVWDYMKNGAFAEETETLTLEWVGKVPGKRESRRVYGDHVLTESDLSEQRRFDDAVAHGGWPIDLHPPAGFYDDQGRGAGQWHLPGPYAVPYRSLYARDCANVLLAGRHVSASHVAFGSLRVQMSLATVGQAAGTAAAVCEERGVRAAAVADDGSLTTELQDLLLREDQWVIGVPNRDERDLAREATVGASSTHPPAVDEGEEVRALDDPLGVHLSRTERLESLSLYLAADRRADLSVEVHAESAPENYVPHERVATRTVTVPAGGPRWVEIPVECDPGEAEGVFLVLDGDEAVRIHGREGALTGVLALPYAEGHDDLEGLENAPGGGPYWGQPAHHGRPPLEWTPRFRTEPAPEGPFAPANVTDGFARPFGVGHSWLSTAGDGGEEWLELAWAEPRTVAALQFACNTRLTKWFNVFGPEDPAEPETVRDYRIEVPDGGEGWRTLARETGNRRRFRRHRFDPVETDRLRLIVEATHGAPRTELFEVRAYGPESRYPLGER